MSESTLPPKKKHLRWIALFSVVLAGAVLTFGKEDVQDRSCFESDNLRFSLSGEFLSVPRKGAVGFSCPDQRLEKECTIKGRDICQKARDPALQIDQLVVGMQDLLGVSPEKKPCDSKVMLRLGRSTKIHAVESDEKLVQRFISECSSEKHYQNYCRHYFFYSPSIHAKIQYDYRCYPPERMAELLHNTRIYIGNSKANKR